MACCGLSSRLRCQIASTVYVTLAVLVGVIACASWDFSQQATAHNIIFAGALLLNLLFTSWSCCALAHGMRTSNPLYFAPFIVSCVLFAIATLALGVYFLVSWGLYVSTSPSPVTGMYRSPSLPGLLISPVLLLFFVFAHQAANEERQVAAKLGGRHVLMSSAASVEEFV